MFLKVVNYQGESEQQREQKQKKGTISEQKKGFQSDLDCCMWMIENRDKQSGCRLRPSAHSIDSILVVAITMKSG